MVLQNLGSMTARCSHLRQMRGTSMPTPIVTTLATRRASSSRWGPPVVGGMVAPLEWRALVSSTCLCPRRAERGAGASTDL